MLDGNTAPAEAPQGDAAPVVSRLGQEVRKRREGKNLSGRALAGAAGLDPAQISRLENGKVGTLHADAVAKLARALDCTSGDLMGEAVPTASGDADGGIRLIPHARIRPSPLNPRRHFDPEALEELSHSVEDRGVLQNLLVRPDPQNPGDFLIVAGERRWRAAGLVITRGARPADWPLPARVEDVDEAEHRALAIIENAQRVDVSPLEEAEGFRALLASGWTTDRIAAAIRKTPRHVQLRLALTTRLIEMGQTMLADGRINLATARALTVAPPPVQRWILNNLHDFRTAEDVAAYIRQGLFPASRAIFDLALYTGERAEDPESGEDLLLDLGEARRLQVEAIQDKVEQLSTTNTWVILKDQDAGWRPGGEDGIHELKDGVRGGAVVCVAPDFSVRTYTSLDRPTSTPAAPPPADGPTWSPEDIRPAGADAPPPPAPEPDLGALESVSQRRRLYALRAKTQALQAAMAFRPETALHQLVLALMGCSDVCAVQLEPLSDENSVVCPALASCLTAWRKHLGPHNFEPITLSSPFLMLARTDGASVTVAALDVLSRLEEMGPEELQSLLADLVMSRCGTRFRLARANLGDGPLAIAAAQAAGADMEERWRMDEAYLATLTRDQIMTLARDLGMPEDEVTTLPLAANDEEAARWVYQHAVTNGIRHVPPELRWATRGEIEAALLAAEGGAA